MSLLQRLHYFECSKVVFLYYSDFGYSCDALGRLVVYHWYTLFSGKAWDQLLLGRHLICQ